MNTLSDYDKDDLAFAAEVENEETQEVRKVLKQFLETNHQKYTLYQMSLMLNVTPAFIQDQLSDIQRKRCGRRATTTIVILRDMDKFEEDKDKWQ